MIENYTKRELDSKFEQIKLSMDAKHADNKETLQAILSQTQKTNGRVSSLENWKWMIVGGLMVVSIIVVPLLLNLLKK